MHPADPGQPRPRSTASASVAATRGARPCSVYQVAPVHTAEQQHIVNALVRGRFAWRGYCTEALAHDSDESHRLTLGAWANGELAATLTLVRDSLRGLQTDALYATELARLRRAGRRLCEVSRLAVDPVHSCPNLLRTLFYEALVQGSQRFAASDVVIGVNPRHASYYKRRMGFRQLGAAQHYARVGAPVVLLHQTLAGMLASPALKPCP